MQTAYESPFFHLLLDEQRSVAWLTRTAQSSKDDALIQREIRALIDFFATKPTLKGCLVVDVRAAIGRNDDVFESVILRQFNAVNERFSRVAILVATPAGKLQVTRLGREQGVRLEIFDDEALARAFAELGPSQG